MMMLHRSASESAFSKTHRTHAPTGLSSQDSSNTEDGGLTLASTPSIRTLPGRSSFTTPPRRAGSLRTREPSESTPSSSTSQGGSQQLRKPASGSLAEFHKHRVLGKSVSQQTVLSGSSTTAFSKTAWASEVSVDTADGPRGSRKSSRSSSRRHLVLPPPSGDEDEDGYEPIYFAARDSSSSPVKPSNQNTPQSPGETPTSPHNKKPSQDENLSPGVLPGSPKRQNKQNRYHPRNEKFPIPNSPNTRKSPSVKSPDNVRDDVFDYSHPSRTTPASRHAPANGDVRSPITKETTPVQGRGRKPSREVLLEFPSESNTNTRPNGRVAQQTERVKEERRDRVQNSNTPSRQVIRSAQSVPRLDAGLAATTPTNSPDRSTRPRSVVDVRERRRHKSNGGSIMCDFFFFFRWGKKKDKRSPSEEDGQSDDNSRSRSRGKSRFYVKSGDSGSPSGSKDKHSKRRSRSRSKDKNAVSSRDRSHHSSRHPDREGRHHSQNHRPSSSTSRPLRTPTSAEQTSEPQYRQYRHHHRREQQHHKKQHHSPDENRPPPQQYTPSRQKRERPKKQQHRRGRRSGKSAGDDAKSHLSDGTVGLRHEDLPLHPSIAQALVKSTQKTSKDKAAPVSGNYLKNTFVRAPGTGGVDQMRRGWKRSRSESPSNLRPSTGHSGSTTNIAGESSNGGGEGGGELRDRSLHSASRTDLDSNFHYTESSTDHQRRHSGLSPAGINRSRSFPGFEPSHNAAHYYNPDADTKVINDAEDFEFKPTDMNGPLHLSFCGCGFVGMYHLGVVSCLLTKGETFLERVDKVAGSSAGALMAAVMLCAPDRLEDVGEQLQALARELRSRPLGALTPGYSFARALRLLLDDVLPEDAHLLVSGRLHISLTAAAGQGGGGGGGGGGGDKGKKKNASNELMTEFDTREELVEALVATSYIPLYAGMKMPVIKGKKYMDGCFSNNMPSFSTGRTITVSPFDGRSDIAPKAGQEAQKKAHFINVLNQEYQVNIRNMKKGAHAFFPPKRHVMQEYFDLGRYDASRFLIREGLYTIRLIHSAEKAVYVSSV